MVTWSTSTPRSASSSSTSRYDSAKRRYQRTASTITSGGKQKPANADRATAAERGRRVLMAAVCLLPTRSQRLQQCPCSSRTPAGVWVTPRQHRPHQRQAGALAGQPADHLGAPAGLPEGPLDQVGVTDAVPVLAGERRKAVSSGRVSSRQRTAAR